MFCVEGREDFLPFESQPDGQFCFHDSRFVEGRGRTTKEKVSLVRSSTSKKRQHKRESLIVVQLEEGQSFASLYSYSHCVVAVESVGGYIHRVGETTPLSKYFSRATR